MKSQIFKTAWFIFKQNKVSFSKALKTAWEFSKNAKVSCSLNWNKKEVTSYSIKTEFFNGAAGSLISLYSYVLNAKPYNMNGAALWYDGKTFNND